MIRNPAITIKSLYNHCATNQAYRKPTVVVETPIADTLTRSSDPYFILKYNGKEVKKSVAIEKNLAPKWKPFHMKPSKFGKNVHDELENDVLENDEINFLLEIWDQDKFLGLKNEKFDDFMCSGNFKIPRNAPGLYPVTRSVMLRDPSFKPAGEVEINVSMCDL